MGDTNDGTMLRDENAEVVAGLVDVTSEETTWLFSYDRKKEVYQELLWMFWASSAIDFSPGNGSFILACIRMRVRVVAVFKTQEHFQLIEKHLMSSLKAFMDDPSDERIHVVNESEAAQSGEIADPEKKKEKKTAKSKKDSTSSSSSSESV